MTLYEVQVYGWKEGIYDDLEKAELRLREVACSRFNKPGELNVGTIHIWVLNTVRARDKIIYEWKFDEFGTLEFYAI